MPQSSAASQRKRVADTNCCALDTVFVLSCLFLVVSGVATAVIAWFDPTAYNPRWAAGSERLRNAVVPVCHQLAAHPFIHPKVADRLVQYSAALMAAIESLFPAHMAAGAISIVTPVTLLAFACCARGTSAISTRAAVVLGMSSLFSAIIAGLALLSGSAVVWTREWEASALPEPCRQNLTAALASLIAGPNASAWPTEWTMRSTPMELHRQFSSGQLEPPRLDELLACLFPADGMAVAATALGALAVAAIIHTTVSPSTYFPSLVGAEAPSQGSSYPLTLVRSGLAYFASIPVAITLSVYFPALIFLLSGVIQALAAKATRTQLQESGETLRAFTGYISHSTRVPLNAAQLAADELNEDITLAVEDGLMNPDAAAMLEILQNSLGAARAVLDDVLTLESSLQRGAGSLRPTWVRGRDLLGPVRSMFEGGGTSLGSSAAGAKDLDIIDAVSMAGVDVFVDHARLTQEWTRGPMPR
ncbi:hypothetical protein FNF29_04508 [Cafeteria roenbergensis]|uniref:Signal transduction histidine kinase dimerisation/phosphoacceptor domain-containing protein n=1 Tax=Cafeteria roenbergensis TaxID=33653 RepID=A0A5A8CG92_CAFRO|nr:hypothetical protein FNF29_04508 [Cafeteria roenbergensis]|eukprot:KAA0151584.1 hypothetical protein FNF29_04508 [Cafeteria roenbergensis]